MECQSKKSQKRKEIVIKSRNRLDSRRRKFKTAEDGIPAGEMRKKTVGTVEIRLFAQISRPETQKAAGTGKSGRRERAGRNAGSVILRAVGR
jgi:hypothetical protein